MDFEQFGNNYFDEHGENSNFSTDVNSVVSVATEGNIDGK